MRVKTVLQRYFDEHVTYLTTDTPRITVISMAHLKNYFTGHIGDITADDSRRYAKYRGRGRQVKGRTLRACGPTVRRELSTLMAAYSWGLKAKWLTPEDYPHIVLPTQSSERDIWLRRNEAQALIEASKQVRCGEKPNEKPWRLHLFIVTALFTGARPTAVRYLKWDMVDRRAGLIDFRGAAKPNSKKRYVVVRMMSELKPHIENAWRRRGEGGTPYFLGHTQTLENGFHKALAIADRTLTAAGGESIVERGVTPNSLRHSWATWSSQDGVDLFMIARMLGNSLKVVEDKYAHWHPSYQRDAIERKFFAEAEA